MEIRVKEIAQAAGGSLLCGDSLTPLRHISIDSRAMRGDDLFVPLIGEKNDAHRFIGQAMENGAAAALTSRHETAPKGFTGALIRVEDTKAALQAIGAYIRRRLCIPLVGITGSGGKTTTREMTAAALSAAFRTFKTPANHNSQVGVPITISEIGRDDEIGVLELGMSEPGEMEVIARLAAVDAAVFTNIGVTHIENLGSRERILEEKLHIQDGMKPGGAVFLNADNDLLKTARIREDLRVITYGTGPDADYRAEEIRSEGGFASFILAHGSARTPVRLGVMGEHNISNALAALAVADSFGVSPEQAAAGLSRFTGFEGRQQVETAGGVTVIDDTYNASPDSMKAGLRVLSSFEGGRRIAVLADMKELGPDAPRFHREIGIFLQNQPVEELITYGELAAEIAAAAAEAPPAGIGSGADPARDADAGNCVSRMARAGQGVHTKCFKEGEMDALLCYLEGLLQEGDTVLFKGSHSMGLGAAAARFKEKR